MVVDAPFTARYLVAKTVWISFKRIAKQATIYKNHNLISQ